MQTLKLQVGKTYRNRKGEEVKITGCDGGYYQPYKGTNGEWYTEGGKWSHVTEEHPKDLIEEVPENSHTFNLVPEALTAIRYTFDIPDGMKKGTVSQEGNRIIVEIVPEEAKEPKPGDSEFKEGDIVFEDGRIMIVKMYPNLYHAMFYASDFGLHINGTYGIPFTSAAFRLATAEEAQMLFDALKKAGKRWNPETMQVEDIPEIDRIREWVEKHLEDGHYNQEGKAFIAEMISHYLKHKEGGK